MKVSLALLIGKGLARSAPNLIYTKGHGTQIGHCTQKVKQVKSIETGTSTNDNVRKEISEKI